MLHPAAITEYKSPPAAKFSKREQSPLRGNKAANTALDLSTTWVFLSG